MREILVNVRSSIKSLLSWSDRIGSDEIHHLSETLGQIDQALTRDEYMDVCIYCKGDNLDYQSITPEDGIIILPKTCLDCGKESEEVYSLTYLRTDKI